MKATHLVLAALAVALACAPAYAQTAWTQCRTVKAAHYATATHQLHVPRTN
jgi:hypothetical protein